MTKIKQVSFNMIKWVKEKQPLSFIEKQLVDKMESENVINRATTALSGEIYYEPWCKALLCLIEYNQSDDSKVSWIDIKNRELHVEHVLPQKFEYISGWEKFKSTDYTYQYLQSGANITLLSGAKNIEASNNAFEIKINVYKGKGKYSDGDTKITAFRITQQIVDDYMSGKYQQQWNWAALQDRWDWFCDQVEELFDINMSGQREEVRSLDELAAAG